jgi:hypothetical protein
MIILTYDILLTAPFQAKLHPFEIITRFKQPSHFAQLYNYTAATRARAIAQARLFA